VPVEVALGVLVLVVTSAAVAWHSITPGVRALATENPERTELIDQRIAEARARGEELELRWTWVPLDRISPNLVRTVVVAEDYRFRQHAGVDWISLAEEVEWTGDDAFSWWSLADLAALRRALVRVWANRDEVRGRSTITQQLAKNLWFGTDRSFARKGLELVAAGRLEKHLDKDRILELYLNVVEFGPGLFGAEAASRHYFGRPASALTLDQAAALAGTLPHPLASNPAHRPGRMEWRKASILARLDAVRRGREPTPIPEPDPALVLPGLPEIALDSLVVPPLPDTSGAGLDHFESST